MVQGDEATITTAQVVAIDVRTMDKGQGFEIIYYSKLPEIAATPGTFLGDRNLREDL